MTEWLSQMLNDAVDSGSVLIYFFVFAGGVLASFTPCTYPVMPLTVGYIGNMSGGSRFRGFLLSVALVSGMALVYAVFGTVFAALGMQFGAIWGNGWAVFAIAWFFILMSLFLLDIFTFPTPKFLYNMQAKVGGKKRQGFVGALLVGGVSGLVVGPCTGPILAIVIVAVSTTLQQAEGAAFAFQAAAGGLKLFLFGFGHDHLMRRPQGIEDRFLYRLHRRLEEQTHRVGPDRGNPADRRPLLTDLTVILVGQTLGY